MNQPRPPEPDDTPNTSSAAISVRHANAQPILSPVRMLGNAAGMRILPTYDRPRRPVVATDHAQRVRHRQEAGMRVRARPPTAPNGSARTPGCRCRGRTRSAPAAAARCAGSGLNIEVSVSSKSVPTRERDRDDRQQRRQRNAGRVADQQHLDRGPCLAEQQRAAERWPRQKASTVALKVGNSSGLLSQRA